jgi:mono/diheme cytochrome c family protein
MKTRLVTLSVTVLVSMAGGIFFIYSGIYDVSASTPHLALTKWAVSSTMQASVEQRAKKIEVPDWQKEELILEGINDFEAMCVTCHGAPGKKPGPLGKGLNPQAPDLQRSAEHLTAAELFWVTKHGIKMTGMPAWGATHDDDSLWPVVALMTALPDLNAETYADLLIQAGDMGHHASDKSDEGHSHEEREAGNEIHGERHQIALVQQGEQSKSTYEEHGNHEH